MVGRWRWRKVLVQLQSGETVEGFSRRAVSAGHVVVRVPRIVHDEESSSSLEGLVAIPLENVKFRQELS